MGLIGREVAALMAAARDVKPVPADDLDIWERRLEQQVVNDSTIRETESWRSSAHEMDKAYSKIV